MEPMLVPTTQSTGTRNSSRTRSTPMCATPRAPPPLSTRQVLPVLADDGPGAGASAAGNAIGARPLIASSTSGAKRRIMTAKL